jgi:hypothetical protein
MFEQQLQNNLFNGQGEKTFIDKVLAKDDVLAIREIVKKPKLTREDLLEVLYLISGTESKLLNYGEWDRYVILKFFVWIREFIKVAELLYDYEDNLKEKSKKCTCKGYVYSSKEKETLINKSTICKCETPHLVFELNPRTRRLLDNIERLIEHNAKFLVDLYLNIGRTSLSIGATGLMELLKNKYELVYPDQQLNTPTDSNNNAFKFLRGK